MFQPLADRWLPRVGIGRSRTLTERLAARLGLDGERLVVEVTKSTGYRFAAFGPNSDSYHQKACSLYIETGSEDAVRQFLHEEVGRLRPTSLAEFLFGNNDASLSPLTELSSVCRFLPWEPRIRTASGIMGQREHTFGPPSEEKLIAEVRRMADLVDSIRELGYRPERFASGHVRGTLLSYGDDYRFLVTEGMHRVAALAAAGHAELEVRPARKRAARVDAADVDRWPHVRSGYCSRELALRMVRGYFDERSERVLWPKA